MKNLIIGFLFLCVGCQAMKPTKTCPTYAKFKYINKEKCLDNGCMKLAINK
jgi:hypothetical protein